MEDIEKQLKTTQESLDLALKLGTTLLDRIDKAVDFIEQEDRGDLVGSQLDELVSILQGK